MSNFFKRTKRAWEENEYDEIHAKRREYPLMEQEAFFPQPTPLIERGFIQPLFDKWKHENPDSNSAESFFKFILVQRKEDYKVCCAITPCHCKDADKCEHPILKNKVSI